MSTIIVTNNYQNIAGGAASGTVSFTPVVSAADGGSITYLADPVVAPVVSGGLAVSLLTTDSFVTNGTVTYRVVERVGSTLRRRFFVEIPSSLGSTVVLSTLSATSTPPNTVIISGGADLDAALAALDARLDALEAATTVAAHAAASDPHSVYLTQTEADALYSPVAKAVPTGGSTGQVLAKNSATNNDVGWVNQTANAVTSPLSVTATATSQVPITATGMAGQTADILDAKLNGGALALGVASDGTVKVGNAAPSVGTLRVQHLSASTKGVVIKQQSAGTAAPIEVQDSAGAVKFAVASDGTVTGTNIGAKVIVLNAADSVPAGTPAGTVILRRP
jgi:hypothetical protein